MVVDVNESRAHCMSRRVDHTVGRGTRQIADLANLAVLDTHIPGKPGITRAVHDVAVLDDQVKHRFSWPAVGV